MFKLFKIYFAVPDIFANYKKSIEGNLAIITAVSLLFIFIGAGAAYDAASMGNMKSKLQNHADAAVLAA